MRLHAGYSDALDKTGCAHGILGEISALPLGRCSPPGRLGSPAGHDERVGCPGSTAHCCREYRCPADCPATNERPSTTATEPASSGGTESHPEDVHPYRSH
jgi:hypothetical protein